MALSVAQADNATAEIAAANWPILRIAQVKAVTSLNPTPQNDTTFTIGWTAVSPQVRMGGLCVALLAQCG